MRRARTRRMPWSRAGSPPRAPRSSRHRNNRAEGYRTPGPITCGYLGLELPARRVLVGLVRPLPRRRSGRRRRGGAVRLDVLAFVHRRRAWRWRSRRRGARAVTLDFLGLCVLWPIEAIAILAHGCSSLRSLDFEH